MAAPTDRRFHERIFTHGMQKCDEGAKWHDPHEDQFRIREDDVLELTKFLDERWLAEKQTTFYELEDHYGVRGAARASGTWERWKLIVTCRYLFLKGSFDKEFWATLTENGKCPAEALSLNSEEEDTICFQ